MKNIFDKIDCCLLQEINELLLMIYNNYKIYLIEVFRDIVQERKSVQIILSVYKKKKKN